MEDINTANVGFEKDICRAANTLRGNKPYIPLLPSAKCGQTIAIWKSRKVHKIRTIKTDKIWQRQKLGMYIF